MASAIDISSLIDAQSRWEIVEYTLAGLVALGCLGEFVHECTSWFATRSAWKRSGGKASALLLVAALAIEIPTQFKVNSINGEIADILGKQEADTRVRAAEIERKYAWRTIQPEQREAFLSSIGNSSFPLVLQYSVSDPEAFEYARQLSILLSKSSLRATAQNIVPLVAPLGLTLYGPESPGKELLAKALTLAGLTFSNGAGQITAIDKESDLRIAVGGRFPPQ